MNEANILVVDDNRDNLRLLSDVLTAQGYRVRPTSKGRRAVSSAQTSPPDLILLDILMPEMDGYEVCRQLKADPRTRDIPIVFLSALSEPFDKVKAFESGGVDYITKPFQEAEVLARVQTHLSLSRLRQRLQDQNAQLEQQIVERTRAEQEIKKARDAANAANRAKSEFLANMSHELRTPLNSILGYTQLLRQDRQLTPKHLQAVDTIHRSGEHLLEMINDVLELSKIEAGKLELNAHEFWLSHALNTIVDMTRINAGQKGLDFSFDLDPALPQVVFGDETRLRQVLINLLGNAVKFTETGGIALRVTRQQDAADSRQQAGVEAEPGPAVCRVLFEVEDSGIGIPPEKRQEVFQPFQQLATRHVGGTGLGLSISARLVRLMGGELQVDSAVGQGSRFWFDLSLPEGEHGELPKDDAPIRHIVGYTGERRKILVVDDHADNRMVLKSLAEELGFETAEAGDGADALRIAAEWRPDLIFMDLVMPVLDGLETTRRIRQTPDIDNTVIILVSASVFQLTREEGRASGSDDFISKPLNTDEVLNKLEQHLQLEWVYEQGVDTLPAEEETILFPSEEDVRAIITHARDGFFNNILRILEKLDHESPRFFAFTRKIRAWITQFDSEAICKFLEQRPGDRA